MATQIISDDRFKENLEHLTPCQMVQMNELASKNSINSYNASICRNNGEINVTVQELADKLDSINKNKFAEWSESTNFIFRGR